MFLKHKKLIVFVIFSFFIISIPASITAKGIKHRNFKSLGGDFKLRDQGGKIFTLKKLTGKVKLLFFGYTNCPDYCPFTLKKMVEVKKDLGKKALDVSFIFITNDPKRDNYIAIKKFLNKFDSEFIGLWGTEEQIKSVVKQYSAVYKIIDKKSENDYLIDHSIFVYLVDQDGILVKIFPFDAKKSVITLNILDLLNKNGN